MTESIFARKKEMLLKFKELTQKQLKLLEENQYEELEELFTEKECLMREVEALDEKLTGQEKPQEELKTLAKKVYDLNVLLEKKLQETKQDLGEKIVQLQKAKKQEHLYRSQPSQVEGVFIDKRS